MTPENPCLGCGACCGFFRVSFYWAEAESGGGSVPDTLTEQVSPHLSCMQGTASKPARCTALLGDIGNSVRCTIYDRRSSTCRNFNTHHDDGSVNDHCSRARAHYGLPPLHPLWPHERSA
ncbi:MAG TPA: YkgJ family cysteine cluster protein [Pseudomonadales bacterium]